MSEEQRPAEGVATLDVERVVPGGDGLSRIGGLVTLVRGALPGDRVRARLERGERRLARGEVLAVEAPGPHRRPPGDVCPRALDGSCGGCDWPAARLESHRELKTQIVRDALQRVGRVPPGELPPIDFVPSPRGYRLRNRLHVDGLARVGFFAPSSHDVSDLTTCEIVSPSLLSRLPLLRDALRSGPPMSGELVTLEGRDGTPLLGELRLATHGSGPRELARSLVGPRGPFDGLRVRGPGGGLLAAEGPDSLELVVGDARFRVSVSAFFQGNRFLLEPFLDVVRRAVGSDGNVRRALDLYAGVGFLSRTLVERAGEVTAVEVEPSAAADLRHNLEAFAAGGLPRARALEATAEDFLSRERSRYDVVVADPPRIGLSPRVRAALLRLAPRALVLVSCDPATFARDLGALRGSYRLASLTLLDLFPQTHHVEIVARLERGKGG